MQLQIECHSSSLKSSSCCLCKEAFEIKEAKVLVCDDQGSSCGEVCSHCIQKGYGWISDRFEQLNQPLTKSVRKLRSQKPKELLIGA